MTPNCECANPVRDEDGYCVECRGQLRYRAMKPDSVGTPRRSEYSGVCTYCGFGLVTNDPRQCCLAGRDVDALERQLSAAQAAVLLAQADCEELKATVMDLRESADVRITQLLALQADARGLRDLLRNASKRLAIKDCGCSMCKRWLADVDAALKAQETSQDAALQGEPPGGGQK